MYQKSALNQPPISRLSRKAASARARTGLGRLLEHAALLAEPLVGLRQLVRGQIEAVLELVHALLHRFELGLHVSSSVANAAAGTENQQSIANDPTIALRIMGASFPSRCSARSLSKQRAQIGVRESAQTGTPGTSVDLGGRHPAQKSSGIARSSVTVRESAARDATEERGTEWIG